jgi:hypothetical protein
MPSNISSGMGVGLARPTSRQQTSGQNIADSAAGLAQKAVKAQQVKSVKVKVKMKGK